MAGFAKGITFTVNDYLTAARLHALIDTAISGGDAFAGTAALINVDSASMVSGVRAIWKTTPASPTTGELLVGADGALDYYTGAAFADVSTNYIALQNNSSITLATGTPVVPDQSSASGFKIAGTAGIYPDVLGVTLTQVNPGDTGNIAYRGKVLCRVLNNSLNAGGRVVIDSGSSYDSNKAQYGTVPTLLPSGQSNVFAITLEPGNFAVGIQQVLLLK